LLPLDNSTIDPNNPSCISNQFGINGTSLQYIGVSVSQKSSILIHGNSLLSNRTYQFMVYMENRRNISKTATGYLLVQVNDIDSQMIIVA
jgi:hypothetical protein